MSLQVYFLHSYLDYFSKCSLENVRDKSEGQSEKFHQDMKKMEKIYKGR